MTHFIVMSGSAGCIPEWCAVYETEGDAADAATDMFSDIIGPADYENQFRAELAAERYVNLRGTDAGADYVEIVECSCANPHIHEDS